MYRCMSSYVQPTHFCCLPATIWHTNMAASRERFVFSLQSASNVHSIERNESSSANLPTTNDMRSEIGKTSDVRQFQVTLQRGRVKHK